MLGSLRVTLPPRSLSRISRGTSCFPRDWLQRSQSVPKNGIFHAAGKNVGFSHFIFQNHIEKIENLDSFPNLRYGSSCSRGFPWIPLAGREGGVKFQPSGHGGLGHLPPPHPPRALQVPLPGWKPHPEGGKPVGPAPPERPGPVPQPDPGAGHRWEKRERLRSAAGVCGMHIPRPPCLSFPGCWRGKCCFGNWLGSEGRAVGVWGDLGWICASLYPGRGAAPQPPDPRPDWERVHPAGRIQVGQEREEREKNPPKIRRSLGVT